MPNANYQIVITDIITGDVLDILDTSRIQSLEYSKMLNDIGEFQISLSNTDRAINYYGLDNIVDIYRDNGSGYELDSSYLMRDYSSDDTKIDIISGVHLNHILKRRQIIPDDDPSGAGGYSSKAGFADSVSTDYVTDNCISPNLNTLRIVPNLTASTPTNAVAYQTFQRRNQEDNLLEVLQEIANQGNVDFNISHSGNANFIFTSSKIGGDYRARQAKLLGTKRLFFSEKFGNLVNPEFSILRKDEATLVLVGGDGIEEDTEYISLASNRIDDSPLNRIEIVVSGSQQDTTQLVATGKTALKESSAKTEFEFEIDASIPNTKYKIDYDLGDYVTAEYNNLQFDFRIVEIRIRLDSTGENITNRLQIENDDI